MGAGLGARGRMCAVVMGSEVVVLDGVEIVLGFGEGGGVWWLGCARGGRSGGEEKWLSGKVAEWRGDVVEWRQA